MKIYYFLVLSVFLCCTYLLGCSSFYDIHDCVMHNNLSCLKARINEGDDINKKTKNNKITPLHYAAAYADLKTVEYLLKKGADINALDSSGNTPLLYSLSFISLRSAHKNITFKPPLNYKTEDEQIKLIEYLLNKGADVNVSSSNGKTPLHYSLRRGMPLEIVELLVSKGASVNVRDGNGWTPLHCGAYANSERSVRLLVKNGANTNVKNNDGKTPLYYAIKNKNNKLSKLLKRVLNRKAEIQKKVNDLTTIKFSSNEPLIFSPWIEKMIGYSKYPETYCCNTYSKTKKPFKEVQKIAQELTNRYLSLADISLPQIIPKPQMPPKLKIVQGKFESDEFFENRVLSEIRKRDETINKLQVDYRNSVEKRNKILNDLKKLQPKRKEKMKEQKYLFLKDAVYCIMGGFKLLNPYFEKKSGLLYFDVSAINSEYTERIAIKPSTPELTKTLYQNPQKIILTVLFSLTNDSIILSKVKLKFKENVYLAHVKSETKHNYASPLEAIIDNAKEVPLMEQVENIKEQNPNLVDRYQISAISYRDGRQLNVNYNDDLPKLLKQYSSIAVDKKKWLFIIGIEKYKNTDNIMYSRRSAEFFKKVAQKTLGISKNHTYCLIDEEATSGAIKDNLIFLTEKVNRGDIIYFYYSGHGIPVLPKNEPYILPQDKVPDFVSKENFFKLNQIYRFLSESKASKIIAFVDSCFSGATDGKSVIKGVAASRLIPKSVLFDEEKMVILSAGRNKQYSNMYSDRGHRLFSYFLMKSLLSGRKKINAIYEEVFNNVLNISREMGDIKKQEPTIRGNQDISL